jgi:hypothetical protein
MTPDALKYLARQFPADTYGSISVTVGYLVAIAAFAYVIDPLIGVMTKFLEGGYFPPPVAGWLATNQTRKVRDLDEEEQAKGKIGADISLNKEKMIDELLAARELGASIGWMRNQELIEPAKVKIEELDQKQDQQRSVLLNDLQKAAALLKKALESNCADPTHLAKGAPETDLEESGRLHLLHSAVRSHRRPHNLLRAASSRRRSAHGGGACHRKGPVHRRRRFKLGRPQGNQWTLCDARLHGGRKDYAEGCFE